MMDVPRRDYVVSTNATDPLCDTGFGGYVDLEGFGIVAQAGITGDAGAWTAFGGQNPIQFYGVDNAGMGFTSDGWGYFNTTNVAFTANTGLPDPADPNDIAPILWNDMQVVYDAGTNRGVSLATAGADLSSSSTTMWNPAAVARSSATSRLSW
jgi:hypothetical protein